MYAQRTSEQVLAEFQTSLEGLSLTEVKRRQEQFGLNEIPERGHSLLLLFLRQFKSVLVAILFVALILSLLLPLWEQGGGVGLADFIDAIAIAAILLLNALLGFFQERKAERAIADLKHLSAPQVRVRREGVVRVLPSRELVPGDILLLEEGDHVSADGRVLLARNVEVDEASLTGESQPVPKHTDPIPREAPLADQRNMVFRGTVIVRGRLEVCVTATGLRTELGKIAQLVADVRPPPTPLERSMTQLGRLLGIVVLVLCAIIFTVGVLRGLRLPELLLAAASLAVSAVPEGLPAIVTVSLALGVQRMIRRRVLTRRLHAIETLGSVTVICTDKTGTVTENRMEVQEVWVQGGEPAVEQRALQIGASCNNAHSLDVGDPTEIGLLAAAERRGVRRLPILREDQPFTAEEKYMVTTHRIDGEELQYLKGAPERLLSLSTHHLSGDAVHPLTEEDRMEILRKSDAMASRALRVLAVGEQQGEQTLFIGLVGLLDPPRTGVAEAIERACAAGIRTILITGDHALTACAIAQRVGISGEVVVGATLDTLSEGELQECVGRASVFARVTPLHKVRILEALQKRGEVVAMGGDGVNDAPALRKAHVGFAMGKQGTDVARDTADIVLTDDHYASVVEAIEEGRTIYDNVRKFITFLLRANFDELLVVLGAMLFGIPLPYLPVHILLINLLTDSLPAMALALEAPEGNVMCRPPRDPKEHLLSGEYTFIGLAAIIAAIAAFHVFTTTWGAVGEDLARSMTLTTAILFELTLVFTCRSKESLFRIGLFSNHALLGAVAIAFFFLLLLLYTPLAPFVHLLPLSPAQWMLPLVWSIGALLFFELLKLLRYNDTICPRGSRSSSSGS